MTDDPGLKQMLRFLLARDTMHQNMWLAAIEQLKQDGLEEMPVPEAFPDAEQETEFAYSYIGFSAGGEAADGRWASGPSPDGKGEFTYHENPEVHAPEPNSGQWSPGRYRPQRPPAPPPRSGWRRPGRVRHRSSPPSGA